MRVRDRFTFRNVATVLVTLAAIVFTVAVIQQVRGGSRHTPPSTPLPPSIVVPTVNVIVPTTARVPMPPSSTTALTVPRRTTTARPPAPTTSTTAAPRTTTTARPTTTQPPSSSTTTAATCVTVDGLSACRANRGGQRTTLRWDALRRCESNNRYDADTGNGYYGAYQFTLSTWRSVGGSGNPAKASPAEQDHRAALLFQRRGRAPWPQCGRYL